MTDHLDIDRAAADRLLTTTRAVRRRLDLDREVERSVILECIEIALQAPSSARPDEPESLAFVVVTEPGLKEQVAVEYRAGQALRRASISAAPPTPAAAPDATFARVRKSGQHLAENLHAVPALVIPCVRGEVLGQQDLADQAARYGSVLPAVWSFMLAARARGLGTAWTTVHLGRADQVATILQIPAGWTQVALVPVAWYVGDGFKPARRRPSASVTHWNSWSGT